MTADIVIDHIADAYYYETDNWKRDFFAPRNNDGIVLFTEGEIEYSFSDKKRIAKAGDLLILPGNVPYSGQKRSKTVAFFVIDFGCSPGEDLETLIGPAVIPLPNYNATRDRFSKAVAVWEKQRIDAPLQIKSFLYSILGNAVNADKENSLCLTDTIIDYICQNISDHGLCVKKLCEMFYISESQLRRNMVKQTGMKPNAYINSVRLNMAKRALTYTTDSISRISEKCGFASAYYFTNYFSKCTGMTPTQYRKQTQYKL